MSNVCEWTRVNKDRCALRDRQQKFLSDIDYIPRVFASNLA